MQAVELGAGGWLGGHVGERAGGGDVCGPGEVTDPDRDLDEIAQLVDEYQLDPVWVMPEGTAREKVLAGMDALYDPATARGWNVSTRLHILTGAR